MKAKWIFLWVIASIFCGCAEMIPAGREELTISGEVDQLLIGATTDDEKLSRIFDYVQNEILFGWVYPQDIPAEEVLRYGRGVCMQKTNLFIAMAREAGFTCRFHFMYVNKQALQDFLPDFAYENWVDPFPHTLPEVLINGEWRIYEATFDRELHQICLDEGINFARYPDIVAQVELDYTGTGVIGHQQYWKVDSIDSFYGETLAEFTDYVKEEVPLWKQLFQPSIFQQAQDILDELRG